MINLKNKRILNFDIANENIIEIIEYMDKITSKNKLNENIFLYRGLINIEFIKNFEIGFEFEEEGYTSTSFDKKVSKKYAGEGWLMKIRAMKGTKGAYLKPYSSRPEEIEYLLPRKQKFLITRINRKKREFNVIIL